MILLILLPNSAAEATMISKRSARSAAKAAKRRQDSLAALSGRAQGGPKAAAPRSWVKVIKLRRPCNVWGPIEVPRTLHGLLDRRVVAVGDGNPDRVLRPDLGGRTEVFFPF